MNLFFDEKLKSLARDLGKPIYAVGGYVRNFLIDGSISEDVDLAAAITVEELLPYLDKHDFKVIAEYKRTGTVVFCGNGIKYEFTTFRKEKYGKGGVHTPTETEFTEDIKEDALRRDFKCNAVYYDIKNGISVDPLNGAEDIINKIIDTVCDPKEVFSHDGLRLMRLARFSSELNFKIKEETLKAAKEYSDNIIDISPERILVELEKILASDSKYPFSDKTGGYDGLKILDETRVLDKILPELTLGRGMIQRADFHNYDVLEHSLRAVLYSTPDIRLAALLHDVGKPFCMINYGKFHLHGVEGVKIADKICERLKIGNKKKAEILFLTENHMLDMKCDMKEKKVRTFIVDNYRYIDKLLELKQADYSACKDDLSVAPTVERWKNLIEEMKSDGTPFTFNDLKINSNDLMALGYSGEALGEKLKELKTHAVKVPADNNREILLSMAKKGT